MCLDLKTILINAILLQLLFIFTVETCKPFLLRKKLFQCSNLLEVVKFLVNHVDISRLHAQEPSTDKSRYFVSVFFKIIIQIQISH